MEKCIFNLSEREWKALRGDFTLGVFGKSLVPEGLTDVKVVWTRVAESGKFPGHRDPYHHVFFFISGEGAGWVDGENYEIRPGKVVQVPAGVDHGYRNTGKDDLILLTLNIPAG
jgi:mannose-6-phosphate isomerase-like protein (cupin superfamily)